MKMKYISKIQSNLKRYQTIHTNRVTNSLLDGSYKSIYKGKSMNFDELREYVMGDDIKDMDWKASARSQKMLVRQYIAERKHNVMLVMDTNRRMLGDSEGLEEKRELAIMSAGTLAYFVNKNGDFISAAYGTENSLARFPLKTGLGNIEMILEGYHKSVTMENHSDINNVLEYIVRNEKRRMILIIVTDLKGIQNITETTLKRLLVAHDILLLNMSDADFTKQNMYNLEDGYYLSSFFSMDKKLARLAATKKKECHEACMNKLKKYGISCSTINYLEELDKEIIDLLTRHKMEKR